MIQRRRKKFHIFYGVAATQRKTERGRKGGVERERERERWRQRERDTHTHRDR